MSATATLETPSSTPSSSVFPWDVPSIPSLDTEGTERVVAALPDETFQLIVREAYLFRAGQILMKALDEAKARRDEVSSTRPPFLLLRRSETKDAFQANLTAANDDFSL